MREIRFRGKEHTGEWITGGFVHKNGVPHIVAHIVDRGVDEWRAIPVIPATIGQFTGLTDKNGVEVYEGDILSRNNAQFPMCGPVEYENGSFFFHDEELGFCQYLLPDIAKRGVLKELEVVGNIHDDAGLLTPKDN